jgi:hypothetical protein
MSVFIFDFDFLQRVKRYSALKLFESGSGPSPAINL